jgi:16S rRNA (guanine966-N2)-methyltransferase
MPKEEPQLNMPRIVGGRMRGRKLLYSGDARTRPMKDRVREAVFNLIGDDVAGAHAIDLFAGTGALGLEAISRGAARATFIEQHFPTADLIRRNVEDLGVTEPCTIEPANTFIWAKRNPKLGEEHQLVFCSPPFAFYENRKPEMLELLSGLIERGPRGSLFVVEADERFDFGELPRADEWDVRTYPPAIVGVFRK